MIRMSCQWLISHDKDYGAIMTIIRTSWWQWLGPHNGNNYDKDYDFMTTMIYNLCQWQLSWCYNNNYDIMTMIMMPWQQSLWNQDSNDQDVMRTMIMMS